MPNGVGPLTQAELLAAFRAGTDSAYADPIFAAGDGHGLEVYSQAGAQLARASQSADASFQALYVLPFSGQTSPPAPGDAMATVLLTVSRTLMLQEPLVLHAGTAVDEVATDWGEAGGELVKTGRQYLLQEDVCFFSGDPGPYQALAAAAGAGWGYNNPQPGSLSAVDQPAAGYGNNLGTLAVDDGAPDPGRRAMRVTLTGQPQPDMPVPEHVGQCVQLVLGANAGAVAGVLAWIPAAPPLAGTGVVLDRLLSFEVASPPMGNFAVGEPVTITNGPTTTGLGFVLASAVNPASGRLRVLVRVAFEGAYAAGSVATGRASGYAATITTIMRRPAFAAEAPVGGAGGATWRVLDWVADLGLVVANALAPAGGTIGVLDEIGRERAVPRNEGESDDSYRLRVARPADRITPDAVRRALNLALGPTVPWCLREVGSSMLPGVFYDGDGAPPSPTPGRPQDDAYDLDTVDFLGQPFGLTGSFLFQEPIEYRNAAGDVLQRGWMGRSTAAGLSTLITMIRRQTVQGLMPESPAGSDYIRGLTSGAKLRLSATTPSPSLQARRYHVYLDYLSFRAYFLVALPFLSTGEFGFAYDVGPSNAYDLAGTAYPTFYDGYPVGAGATYLAAYRACKGAAASGVGFDVVRDSGPCS